VIRCLAIDVLLRALSRAGMFTESLPSGSIRHNIELFVVAAVITTDPTPDTVSRQLCNGIVKIASDVCYSVSGIVGSFVILWIPHFVHRVTCLVAGCIDKAYFRCNSVFQSRDGWCNNVQARFVHAVSA
jgi:hypothetical protein